MPAALVVRDAVVGLRMGHEARMKSSHATILAVRVPADRPQRAPFAFFLAGALRFAALAARADPSLSV